MKTTIKATLVAIVAATLIAASMTPIERINFDDNEGTTIVVVRAQ